MLGSKVEKLFTILDQSSDILKDSLGISFLEGLIETGENLFQGEIVQEIDEVTKKKLSNLYKSVHLQEFTKEDLRKAFQLCILKGMRDFVQPHHQMTPDTIGLLISELLGKFLAYKEQSDFSVLDPAVGTGNLLTTILNLLPQYHFQSYGVEVDEMLIKLTYIQANLQQHEIELFNQDALDSLLIDPVDIVISDLPVGYYPRENIAESYELNRKEGHAYSHYLFIEQSLRHSKPGGLLFFVIPNSLFDGEEAKGLHLFLKEQAHIQAIIQLPGSMFKSEQNAKSIFILQKKKEDVKPPKQVLMVQMPKLSNRQAMQEMMAKIDAWFWTV